MPAPDLSVSWSTILSDIGANPWAMLALGSIISAIIGFYTAVIFSDHFYIPFYHKRFQLFPGGSFKLYAASRESRQSIVDWDCKIYQKRFMRGSYMRLRKIYDDQTHMPPGSQEAAHLPNSTEKPMRLLWEYEGPIIVQSDFRIAYLDLVKYRTKTTMINNEEVATMPRESDPCFILFHKVSDVPPLKPCIISGYDAYYSACYGGVGILVPDDRAIDIKTIRDLLGRDYFLDYRHIRDRVNAYIRPEWRLSRRKPNSPA